MIDAIREAGVHRLAAEVEVGLSGMAERPFADAVVKLEQTRLVRHFGRRLGGNEATRRRRRARGLLFARSLAQEASGTDRAQDRLRRTDGRGNRSDLILVFVVLGLVDDRLGHDRCGGLRRSGDGRRDGAGLGASTSTGSGAAVATEADASAAAAAFASGSFGFTGDGRACSSRRCALPITALRLTPPRASAIWLAVWPASHIVLSVWMRSSVQDMFVP